MSLVEINSLLSLVLTLVTLAAGLLAHLHLKTIYAKRLLTACFAAEKAIDSQAYATDGKLNVAREDMAVTILHTLIPKLDEGTVRTEISDLLALIHSHAQDGKIATSAAEDASALGGVSAACVPFAPGAVLPTAAPPPTPALTQAPLHEGRLQPRSEIPPQTPRLDGLPRLGNLLPPP